MSKHRTKKKASKADPQKENKEPQESKRTENPPNTLDFVDMVIKRRAPNGHNCLHKDSGTSHVMRPRCFDRGHMGICPICKHAASMQDGCDPCGTKCKDLLTLKESRALVKENLRRWELVNESDETHENIQDEGQIANGEKNVK
jgi:hypothetical protein